MAKAWNPVPKSVVLNGRLSTHVLAPHQRAKAEELLKQEHGRLEPALRPQMGASLTTEKVSAAQRPISARREGDAWLATPSEMEDGRGDAGIEDEEVIALVDCPVDMTEDALDLLPLKVIGEFHDHDFQASMDMEDGLDMCQELIEQTAVQFAALGALGSMRERDVEMALLDSESEAEN